MKSFHRKLLWAFCSVVSFGVLFLLLYLPVQPKGNIFSEGWEMKVGDEWRPVTFPFQYSITEMTTLVFRTEISYPAGDAMILTGLKGQAVRIDLDGNSVIALGDLEAPTANIWNKTFIVPLPEEGSPSSEMEIQLSSASFPISISIPPYTIDKKSAALRVMWIDFIYNDILLTSVGAALLIGLLLIVLSLIRRRTFSAEIYFGLASVMGAIETFDFQFRVSTGTLGDFLVIKKILMIAGYLAAFLFMVGMEKYFQDRLRVSKYLAAPSIVSVFIVLIQPDLIRLSQTLTYLNMVTLIDLVGAVYFIFKDAGKKNWLVLPAIWLILGLLEILAVQIFHFSWPYVMAYIILLSTILFGVNLLIEFNQVFLEKEDLEKRIDIDTLTTAYNRNVLGKASKNQYNVLILMDLDNFKSYNDRHGHQKGDRILVQFAEIVKNNLRQNDLVVRYGGDEFLVLLSDIGIIDAERVADRIRKEFEELTIEDHLSVSYGIEKIVQSINSDLTKADRLMYAMKQAKRERKI
ncbi:GGDEF domain-containing protein [Pelolinea submarina]|nr:GGDEF domain-containing protein [Pelolinea submarina]